MKIMINILRLDLKVMEMYIQYFIIIMINNKYEFINLNLLNQLFNKIINQNDH